MAKNLNDPEVLRDSVEIIYDLYRKALFNRKYYGDRLAAFKKGNTILEIAIAIGTALGAGGLFFGVGGLFFWEGPTGHSVWGVVALVAVMLAVIKPFLQLPSRIEAYSKMFASYSTMYADLGGIVSEIRAHRHLSPEMWKLYSDARLHDGWLSVDDDPRPSSKKLERYQDAVNQEIPDDRLWVPA